MSPLIVLSVSVRVRQTEFRYKRLRYPTDRIGIDRTAKATTPNADESIQPWIHNMRRRYANTLSGMNKTLQNITDIAHYLCDTKTLTRYALCRLSHTK